MTVVTGGVSQPTESMRLPLAGRRAPHAGSPGR
jgi:hypothetical protein